ncbi:hydrolase 1, exosortase A system-associated [Nitrosomonas sp. H1_AOB3]|uniref:hydrolase 1, exosortase A system-associated n=1 Tax=Nitrosomonas sp. H1_AOB3 TaxID=2741553 RepID=UPI001936D4D9|nr:hydrolase 1, exosortase A system-associated [Nitrosomonas sp. H1_AOB3]QOJ08083.1 MAG: hydrolase 1, exosortase A system-associated [Nitrosomonas sp. H1_AOB3]
MNVQEQAVRFCCHHDWLYGILHLPQQPVTRGVLIVVGGPQYRVGSHRQFVLLARYLAERGIAVMRFDFRGMGDSDGEIRTFEHVGEDLRSAADFFFSECPFLEDIVVWGLCDAASAALFHAHQDSRVSGLVLLNPWVRTEQGIAKAYLKHYYLERLFDPEFWKKLLGGKFNPLASIRSLYEFGRNSLRGGKSPAVSERSAGSACDLTVPLPERMLDGLKRFQGKILIITSGNDLTAREFLDLVDSSADWQATLRTKQTELCHMESANHTFSTREWRDQVTELTANRVLSW